MKSMAAMLFLLLPAFGQTIQITDNSPRDRPITFKWAITFGPGSTGVQCTITGHSNANRVIVAYGGVVDMMRPDGHRFVPPFTHDHFFKDAPTLAMMSPQPHLDWDLDYDCSGFGQNDGHYLATPQSPSMSVSATFVQLDDGSVWRDPQAIKEVMLQRQEEIAYLESLKTSSNLTQALATGATTERTGPARALGKVPLVGKSIQGNKRGSSSRNRPVFNRSPGARCLVEMNRGKEA